MDKATLDTTLEQHYLFAEGTGKGRRADLSHETLRDRDLSGADLRDTALRCKEE